MYKKKKKITTNESQKSEFIHFLFILIGFVCFVALVIGSLFHDCSKSAARYRREQKESADWYHNHVNSRWSKSSEISRKKTEEYYRNNPELKKK